MSGLNQNFVGLSLYDVVPKVSWPGLFAVWCAPEWRQTVLCDTHINYKWDGNSLL